MHPRVAQGRLGSLALCLALIPGQGGWTAGSATTVRTCEPFGTVSVTGGRYVVQQNEWNSSERQCMTVDGTSWKIVRAAFDLATDGPPATYPSIFHGCHWGTCTEGADLPIRVRRLDAARSSWRTRPVSSGAYDVAFDLWTNSTRTTTGQPDGSEIMVWLRSRGGVQPAGTVVGRVRIAGARWRVWTVRMASWNYVAYQRTRPTDSVSRLHLEAFVADSVRRGLTDRSWFLIAAEAGFEIWRGGRGLATRSFSFEARSTAGA